MISTTNLYIFRQYEMAMEDRERTIQHAIEQAEYSQAKHSTYMQRTVTKYVRSIWLFFVKLQRLIVNSLIEGTSQFRFESPPVLM